MSKTGIQTHPLFKVRSPPSEGRQTVRTLSYALARSTTGHDIPLTFTMNTMLTYLP